MRKYKRVNEDILPDEVYNKAWENAKRTYVVTARGAAPYHYEINTEYGIYAKVPNDMGFLAHWFLDTRSKDTVEEMEELASKYIRKYNCKKVSVQEYKKLIGGGVNESYKRRIREGSSYAVGDKMFRLNGINLKDWYTSEYPDDELGYELNDDVDLRRCYSSLGKEPDIYDVMGVGDSIIRERVFAKMADVMGVDYDVIYHKWLDY